MTIQPLQIYREQEILPLYDSVGWTAYTDDPAALKSGIEHSLLTLAAYEGSALVGLIRAVGDGATIVYIQDILVLPAFQRKGIGSALMRAVLEQVQPVRQIVLTTDQRPETMAFYESLGFVSMASMGCCGFMKA